MTQLLKHLLYKNHINVMRYFNSACNLFTDIISFMFKVILGCRYQFSSLYKRTMKFEEASSEKKMQKGQIQALIRTAWRSLALELLFELLHQTNSNQPTSHQITMSAIVYAKQGGEKLLSGNEKNCLPFLRKIKQTVFSEENSFNKRALINLYPQMVSSSQMHL